MTALPLAFALGFSLSAPVADADFDLEAAFQAAMPPRVEALWRTIPWRTSLTDALEEARKADKPVYMFVNDGEVQSGRC